MKLLVNFSRGKGRKPIIAQVVRDTGVLINVERAVIDSSEGEALIDVPDDQCQLVRDSMVGLGATVHTGCRPDQIIDIQDQHRVSVFGD